MSIIYIADIGSNHDGKIERAFELIKLAKNSGANIAKFQFFKADNLINKQAFDKLDKLSHQSKWPLGIYETYKKNETPYGWIPKLKKKCDDLEIEFMGTPYDFEALELLNKYCSKIKIGSGDINYTDFLEEVAKTGKKILLGTGAATFQEVRRARDLIKRYNQNIILMHCNTNYTNDENNYRYLNLKAIQDCGFKGFSDHTKNNYIIPIVISMGVQYIERHLTDGKSLSPDNEFALLPEQFAEMVKVGNITIEALGNGIKKIEENEIEAQKIQRRSYYVNNDISSGEWLNSTNIIAQRPNMGIDVNNSLIGKISNCDMIKNDIITEAKLICKI